MKEETARQNVRNAILAISRSDIADVPALARFTRLPCGALVRTLNALLRDGEVCRDGRGFRVAGAWLPAASAPPEELTLTAPIGRTSPQAALALD